MTTPDPDPLLAAIRQRNGRHARWLRDGEGSVGRRLATIGVLGWIVVIPILIGIFAGRWLDMHFQSGLQFTAPLLMGGAALGLWSAWKWMQGA